MRKMIPALAMSLPLMALSTADILTADDCGDPGTPEESRHSISRATNEGERLRVHQGMLAEWGVSKARCRAFRKIAADRNLSDEEVVRQVMDLLESEGFNHDEFQRSRLTIDGEERDGASEDEELERWRSEINETLSLFEKGDEDTLDEAEAVERHVEKFRQMRERQLATLGDFDDEKADVFMNIDTSGLNDLHHNTNQDRK